MPKHIDHEQRRRDIIDVAWGLIRTGGLEAATLRQIAAQAGFANGALKHYFSGRDDIIEGAFQRALEAIGDHVSQAVRGQGGVEALGAMMRQTLPLDDDAAAAARVLLALWDHAVANDSLRASYRRHLDAWRERLAQLIRQGRQEGAIRSEAADDQLVDEIVLVNIGATVLAVSAPDLVAPDALNRLVDAFLARLSTPAIER
ncbi:MAG: TetR/AcrR family transcriptional regulator [Bifidobacteriaceae bacterium]|jgi:AcrR family transcriptional regulator|nr:TetR/AcrR family transcriptional regulator [Bifidobacteriaceae bacterium]